jgi:zinc D-Ala-D-Ala carboxypeptidase
MVSAAIIGALGVQSASSSASSSSEAHTAGVHRDLPRATSSAAPSSSQGRPSDRRGGDGVDGAVTVKDGALPDGVTVFDDDYAGVANLDPDLVRAIRNAATDAADDGIEFTVNSGWRSPEYQERLLQDAVATYGSIREAARWVATAKRSAHVSGDAIDIGPFDASAWLSKHGAEYGLCLIYRNEPWHFELRPKAIIRGCPSTFRDPTHDPRMQP